MKLIKFIAAAALVASSSLVSGVTETTMGVNQDMASVCPNWPFCREVEIADQASDVEQLKAEVTRKVA